MAMVRISRMLKTRLRKLIGMLFLSTVELRRSLESLTLHLPCGGVDGGHV